MSAQPSLVVLSTFARDEFRHRGEDTVHVRPGGPAHWIETSYERMGIPHTMISSGIEILVSMELIDGEPLPGKVSTLGSRIEVPGKIKADGFLINFLDDFDIEQVHSLDGTIYLDVAHYTRCGEFRDQRQMVPLPREETRSRIAILKANDQEYPSIPKLWADEQKQERVLIHTLGSRGLDLWVKGECHHFDPPSNKPKDVLGAGDTFGAAYLYWYLIDSGDALTACEKAMKEVENLFDEK